MIEIVCPSCGARYQVPDDSIGPEGRKVTCSSCSHKWRAHAPAAAEESVEESPVAAESPATVAAGEGEEAAASDPQAAQGGGREEQMDAIRRMLDDLKRSAESDPEPEPEAETPRRASSQPTMRRREEEEVPEDDDRGGGDPLRSRINQLEGERGGKAARPSNYDAARLRKMHERRARRLQKAKERKKKSGAFLTGFTLVAAVTATMVALYVMHPQIIAASPEMQPAMDEYVGTVDRYRFALDEATEDWRAWLSERVEKLTGGEEEQAAQPQQQESAAASE